MPATRPARIHGAKEDAGQAANSEQDQEHQSVQHRRGERYRSLIHRGDPVEDLDSRRDTDEEGEERYPSVTTCSPSFSMVLVILSPGLSHTCLSLG